MNAAQIALYIARSLAGIFGVPALRGSRGDRE
jgi:hypothetical protein